MIITATDLKTNVGKYLEAVASEDIFVTKNGRIIAKLTNPLQDRVSLLDSLKGIVPQDGIALEDMKKERLSRQ